MLQRIQDGRTDLVFDDPDPRPELMGHCAYYGDVSAIRFLLSKGVPLDSLGSDLGLIGACFHGHWRLCQFLIERGADVNFTMRDTAETPLHSALCKLNSPEHTLIVRILLANGADPNRVTIEAAETGGFMRDCRTRAETPLHRAAAFGDEEAIDALLLAGANKEARDACGDSPLSWGSWYLRPDSILRKLCYGPYSIRPGRATMSTCLRGVPKLQ